MIVILNKAGKATVAPTSQEANDRYNFDHKSKELKATTEKIVACLQTKALKDYGDPKTIKLGKTWGMGYVRKHDGFHRNTVNNIHVPTQEVLLKLTGGTPMGQHNVRYFDKKPAPSKAPQTKASQAAKPQAAKVKPVQLAVRG